MHISKLVLSVILSITLFTQASWAQMASTEVLFEHSVKVSPKEKVIQFTAREDVAKILGQMDVDPKMIEERVASMTDDEVSEIAYQIDTLPAGGSSIIGAVVFVFVLLLVTDILGFTKVFNFTRTVR
ncbi:PA2779 family protein [Sulfurovum sp.]|uniref:PA2779 family protein n=1 Tax=Sulfurovum sp. TaxID=1969726 RepID=UPI0035688DE9